MGVVTVTVAGRDVKKQTFYFGSNPWKLKIEDDKNKQKLKRKRVCDSESEPVNN